MSRRTLPPHRGPDAPLPGREAAVAADAARGRRRDLGIDRGEIVALVGESGSGKSTIARLLARVYQPTRGEIWFEGRLLSCAARPAQPARYSAAVPMVFQDPYSSLNPAYRVSHGISAG